MCAGIKPVASSPLANPQVTVTARIEVTTRAGASPDASGAVVWLTPLDRSLTVTPKQNVQLLQKHKTFTPHLLVLPVGSSVDFPNRDPFFHNVFSLFDGKRFDLGLYEAGSSRTVVFNRPGISYIFCNIHPEMSAVVVALKTPYYAISDHKGQLTIADVPAGRYEMQIWHERVLPEALNALKRIITIAPESSSLGILHVTEERSLLSDHKNKYGQDYDTPTATTPGYVRP